MLQELSGKENRKAHFKCVMALIINGKEHLFEGIMKGNITQEKIGSNGFGYDPVFIPEGHSETFAEMNADAKNAISHRAIALKKLVDFIHSI